MSRYTVGELVEILSEFPQDLEILTHLAFIFDYPDSLYDAYKDNPDALEREAPKFATSLAIFEGDWETGVSNMNGDLQKYWGNLMGDDNADS